MMISPTFGPIAGGTNISVTLQCPDCGQVTLYMGGNICSKLEETRYA